VDTLRNAVNLMISEAVTGTNNEAKTEEAILSAKDTTASPVQDTHTADIGGARDVGQVIKEIGPQGYIHIGPVKTGSTYIQKTFFQNAAVFERFGISYPFVSPLSLDLPRYTNATFLWDRSRDDEAKRLLQTLPKFLISEEAIFFQPWTLRHPAIDGLQTKLVLYVRRPAELILSWVAECAEPYNAVIQSLPDVHGPLSVMDGIEVLSKHYEEGIWRFISFAAGARGDLDIEIRAFDRDCFIDNDLLSDFLHCLGLDAKAVRADPSFSDPGIDNEAESRKFCDISCATWQALGRPHDMTTYNLSLVKEIVSTYQGGDHRPIIETVGDDVIAKLTERFAFFENFLSGVFLDGARVFKNRYPSICGKHREPYRPIDEREIEALVKTLTPQKGIAPKIETGLDPQRGSKRASTQTVGAELKRDPLLADALHQQ
jgi:hypothetical protein